MDNPLLSTSSPIRSFDHNTSNHQSHCSQDRSMPMAASIPMTRLPVPIRNGHEPLAPPPLPPPQYVEDLAQGYDPGWKWRNMDHESQKDNFLPINSFSSLINTHPRPELVRWNEGLPNRPSQSVKPCELRQLPLLRAPGTGGEVNPETILSVSSPNLVRSNPRPCPSLHGEGPLSEKSVKISSNTYDKYLLSKIGKPASNIRSLPSLRDVVMGESTSLPMNPKNSVSAPTDSPPSPRDPTLRWNNPEKLSDANFFSTSPFDYKGRNVSSLTPPVPELDFRERRCVLPENRPFDESYNTSESPVRSDHDQSAFSVLHRGFPFDDPQIPRHLSLDESRSSHFESIAPISGQGMKRRASSPPREAKFRDFNLNASTNSHELGRRPSGLGFPNFPTFPRYHGSMPSMSSASFRNGSLASSSAYSTAASSMTSMSSSDGLSTDKNSPDLQLQDKVICHDTRPLSSPSASASIPIHSLKDIGETKKSVGGRKMTAPSAVFRPKPRSLKMGQIDHELEKQYLCTFCRKRFKNKNEAERHLTSLHLRPHSWSCAALSSYEAAFHPSTSSTDQTLNGSSYDACGFCGKEFPNLPAPEWNKRIDHLTVTHKFRECNHAKKFYRADHFRQHLKHSHAGTSGKWTNTLENACMKEEPIAEYGGGLASIGEQKPSIHYQRTSLRD